MKKKTIEEFIRAWQTSDSTREIANKLDCTTQHVYNRAGMLKRGGVPLKKLARTKKDYDYKKLSELARSLAPKA